MEADAASPNWSGLRRAGLQVTVYDRYDRAGGLMTYGIPGFKLEKDVVMRRNGQLRDGGVQFVLNCNVGTDLSFDAIRGQHEERRHEESAAEDDGGDV